MDEFARAVQRLEGLLRTPGDDPEAIVDEIVSLTEQVRRQLDHRAPDAWTARWHRLRADRAMRRAAYDEADAAARALESLAETLDDPAVRGHLEATRATRRFLDGDLDGALRSLDRAEAAYAEAREPEDALLMASRRPAVLLRAGRMQAGIDRLGEVIARARDQDDPLVLSAALSNRALALMDTGRIGEARDDTREALGLKRAIGDLEGAALCHERLARLAVLGGRLDEATSHLQRARRLAARAGSRLAGDYQEVLLANILRELGLVAEARRLIEQVQARGDSVGIHLEVHQELLLAFLDLDDGDAQAALARSRSLRARLEHPGLGRLRRSLRDLEAGALLALGRADEAARCFEDQPGIHADGALRHFLAPLTEARTWLAVGDLQRAERALERERALLERLGRDDLVLEAEVLGARILEARGDFGGALERMRATWEASRARQQAAAAQRLGALHLATQVDDEAQDDARTRQSRERLVQAGAAIDRLLRERDEALSQAAHDIRSPLTAVRHALDVLTEGRAGLEERREILADATEAVTLIDGRLRRLLAEARQRPPIERAADSDAPVLASEVVRRVIRQHRLAAARKGLALEVVFDGDADLGRHAETVYDILDNLVSNAVKFSERGSPVRVRTCTGTGRLCLEVADEGPGFTEADRSRMFGRFTRLSAIPTAGETSTGLGLYLVRLLTDRLGATLDLQTAPGRGSTFRITLPG